MVGTCRSPLTPCVIIMRQEGRRFTVQWQAGSQLEGGERDSDPQSGRSRCSGLFVSVGRMEAAQPMCLFADEQLTCLFAGTLQERLKERNKGGCCGRCSHGPRHDDSSNRVAVNS
ncbi:hypothetical protein GOP47_0029270 [Adiantum capillus-veneris]|nr:hypothetical protein GOP47_0029270 [Adiantum capillus-veneris]